MDRKKIKAEAKEFAFNHKADIWKGVFLAGIIVSVANYIVNTIFGSQSFFGTVIGLAVTIAASPLSVGLISYLMKLVNGEKVVLTDELFSRYKNSEVMLSIMYVNLIVNALTALFAILLVVPGIIYALGAAMTNFILATQTNKEIQEKKAHNISKEMMDGYKGDFFVFNLSFIGWYLLVCVTLGIAAIWVVPFVNVANIKYFEELKKVRKVSPKKEEK